PAGKELELFGLCGPGRDRLFHQNMLSGEKRALCEFVVGACRSSNDDRVDLGIVEYPFGAALHADARERFRERADALRAGIADCDKPAVGVGLEVADQVRAPVTRADNGDSRGTIGNLGGHPSAASRAEPTRSIWSSV